MKRGQTATSFSMISASEDSVIDWDTLLLGNRSFLRIERGENIPEILSSVVERFGWDVTRLIVDAGHREGAALSLLAAMPEWFRGDAMFVWSDERAFLSSAMPREGRVLYELSFRDLDFYLRTALDVGSVAWREPRMRGEGKLLAFVKQAS